MLVCWEARANKHHKKGLFKSQSMTRFKPFFCYCVEKINPVKVKGFGTPFFNRSKLVMSLALQKDCVSSHNVTGFQYKSYKTAPPARCFLLKPFPGSLSEKPCNWHSTSCRPQLDYCTKTQDTVQMLGVVRGRLLWATVGCCCARTSELR